ncbi:7-cyano-7-deazaguanine synthase QueC [Methanocella sp. MCL-LM]|uniref:7-cyano-7-deazaguanine synthase QueC n=1 Tax=Methanocella sp. MCL-LM TaxID=3412035 RepID=UPI003C7957DE
MLSSGLDSVVAFKKEHDEHGVALAITFDYGQRAASKEIEMARKICARYHIRHEVIELPWLKQITGTALVSRQAEVPEPTEAELDEIKGRALETAHLVWVPNRNGAFINIAAAYGDAMGLSRIVCGFNAEEGATFPDNTPAYVDAVNKSLALSCEKKVQVVAPVIDLNKEEIIREGIRIEAPLDLSWSCYFAGQQPCGKCESCMRRARAFKRAGVPDPSLGGV